MKRGLKKGYKGQTDRQTDRQTKTQTIKDGDQEKNYSARGCKRQIVRKTESDRQ